VAGKPQPALFQDALSRSSFHAPLVIGDRLDTDIAGANAAGLPSLLVLTGVSTASDAVFASTTERPTYIAQDLRDLSDTPDRLRVAPQPAWRVDVGPEEITVRCTDVDDDDEVSVIRAVAHATKTRAARRVKITAGDAAASKALDRWSLLTAPDPIA
jgi:hypothetical protein